MTGCDSVLFHFKKFSLLHGAGGLKITTDGILIGAWADPLPDDRVLDIGTGCGLVACMVQQRFPQADITGIELEEKAFLEAETNFANWPNGAGPRAVFGDIRTFESTVPFDHFVSNPPFFAPAIPSLFPERTLAKSQIALSLEQLFENARRLGTPKSRVSLILPALMESDARMAAFLSGFYCLRLVHVFPKPMRPSHRILVEFGPASSIATRESELFLQDEKGQKSPDFVRLTESFFL